MIQEEFDVFNVPETILNEKSKKYIIIWNVLLIILFISSFVVCVFYKFYEYDTQLGYVKKIEDYKLVLYLKDFSKLNSYKLYLEEEELKFSVYSISEDYYIINNEKYHEIVLNVDLDDIYKVENNILTLKLKGEQTTYLERIKEGIGL